ncbi:M23 family metallopeptidase [Microbacterium suaedae]|uniref:M23 family metallopeptidase n=1 Tax=Microbacterium suaedae TaxID=2067813 RepID=UPI000DA254E0|nr:M23 family metallopeptidase [Microbacterium suaedae]
MAIPAYAATQQDETTNASVRDEAAADAQLFEADSDVATADLASTSYAARTAEEIEQIEAEREALERAREAKRQAEEEARLQAEQQAAAGAPAAVAESPATSDAPAAPAAPATSGGATAPLPGGYTIGQSLGSGRGHEGLDLLVATGTPIYAVHGCVVTYAGYSGAYGNLVTLNCTVNGNSVEVRNAHMSAINVSTGQTVSAGQQIGAVGSTGRSTAPHLHIEIRVNGGLVDPLYYLPV